MPFDNLLKQKDQARYFASPDKQSVYFLTDDDQFKLLTDPQKRDAALQGQYKWGGDDGSSMLANLDQGTFEQLSKQFGDYPTFQQKQQELDKQLGASEKELSTSQGTFNFRNGQWYQGTKPVTDSNTIEFLNMSSDVHSAQKTAIEQGLNRQSTPSGQFFTQQEGDGRPEQRYDTQNLRRRNPEENQAPQVGEKAQEQLSMQGGQVPAPTSVAQMTQPQQAPQFQSFNTPQGRAFFQQTGEGLAAVNDPELIRGLESGQIPSTDSKELPTDGNAFSPVLASEAGATRTPPPSNVETYKNYQSTFGLPDVEQGAQQFNANPLGTIQQITQQVLQMTGMGEANALITDITGELEELENKRDREIRAVNDDPWLTEGVRQRRIQKVEEKWADRINNRTNRLRLLESVRDDARQNAQFALGTAISLWDSERRFQQEQVQFYYQQEQDAFSNKMALRKQELAEAEAAQPDPGTSSMQEYMFAVENGQFSGSFLDWKSSEAAATRAPKSGGGSTDIPTVNLTPTEQRGLIGVGFTATEVDQIEADVSQFGLDTVLEGITDDAQREAVAAAYGRQPDSQPLTPDEAKTKAVEYITDLKDVYSRGEAKDVLQSLLKEALGLKSGDTLPRTFDAAVEDALVEVYGATFWQNIIPGGRGNFPGTPQ